MPNGPIDHLNTDLECSEWEADTLFVSVVSDITAQTEQRQGGWGRDGRDKYRKERERAAGGAQSWKEPAASLQLSHN